MTNQPSDLITNERQGHESKKGLRENKAYWKFLLKKMDFSVRAIVQLIECLPVWYKALGPIPRTENSKF